MIEMGKIFAYERKNPKAVEIFQKAIQVYEQI